jgi:N-terminal domain of (some) glycogen debranching enzymes
VLEISVESDFADLFDVKSERLPRRGTIQTVWEEGKQRLTSRYQHGEFRRALRLQLEDVGSQPQFANGDDYCAGPTFSLLSQRIQHPIVLDRNAAPADRPARDRPPIARIAGLDAVDPP